METAQFKELMDHLDLGVFRFRPDEKGSMVYVNSKIAELLGVNAKAAAQNFAARLFADKKKFLSLCEDTARLGRVMNEEVEIVSEGDRTVICSLSLVGCKDANDKLVCIDGILKEIERERKSSNDLRESKELFQTVFNNSATAIIVTDKDEKIVAWNPFSERMLGFDKKELFNRPLRELFPARDWEGILSAKLRGGGVLADLESRIKIKDGVMRDITISNSMIHDVAGKVSGLIIIMNDITKQKEAERKIRESENKIRILLDNSAIAITMTDASERIISWNRFTEELLGMNKGDLYLKPISSIYPQDEWKKLREANIRKAGSKHHLETKIIRKEGRVIDVELSVNVLKDLNDNIIGSVGIMHDMTRQKRTQRMLIEAKTAAEEANHAKSMFLANMSHEVRTPMNTIMGMVDLTLDTRLNEEQRENLLTVKNAADILLSLLNDILDLSRVESGKIQLENIEINVHNIVKSVCKGLTVLAKNKKLEVEWEIAQDVPDTLLGDPIRIRQILVNLINNAIKFTFKGKIICAVKVKKKLKNDCELLFSVADEGVGIPKDKIDAIFEVFTQADVSTTRKFGGTGLGLAISKKLVQMMGGDLWAESEEFKGSTFYFSGEFKIVKRVPQVLKEKSIEDELRKKLPQQKLNSLNILLAEDNIINQKIAIRMLEKRGWRVKAADNGRQVLDLISKDSFDVILMDAQMPILDGYEATKMIRENEKETGTHIPIIALTARAMSGDRKKCLDAGMDDYVAKPIDRQKLYDTIEKSV